MISIVVIDDEPRARETIINILALSQDEISVAGEADSVETAYRAIVEHNPDLVLLDIHLKDGTGFDLLKKFNPIRFKVVFITAHEEHAVKAFKFSALDYILKPITASDLLQTVSKAITLKTKEETEVKLSAFLSNIEKIRKIVLKTSESIHIVNVKNIVRCEADVNYTTFFLAESETLLVSKTLKEFADLLEPAGFFRTHQSHLVNLDYILRYDKTEGGHLVMSDGSIVPVSSRKKETLFQLFEKM
ncbi:MAG: response regulator transcription factor [Bacteroidales bacterium]|nr:response regulator transcription factor [Bacteroidales bacterium]